MFNVMEMERIGDAYDKPIESCDDITGFSPEAWSTQITPKAKKLIKWGIDYWYSDCHRETQWN